MLHFIKNFNAKDQILGLVRLKGKPTPVLDLFRSNGEKLTAEKVSHYEKKQVLDDGKLTAAITNTVKVLPVNEALAAFVSVGHLLSIGDEYFSVESADPAAKTITVKARGYGGTPVTAHAVDTPVYVVAKIEGEGVVTEDYKKTISNEIKNYLQESTKSVTLTKRAVSLSHKDAVQLEAEETAAKLNEAAQELDRSVLYSVGNFDSESGRHTMSGLKHLITTNGGYVLDAEKNLTDDKLDLFCANITNAGGSITTIILNPLALNKVFKKMQGTIKLEKNDQGNQVAGGVIVGYMPSTMGGKIIAFVTSTNCHPTDMFVLDGDGLYFLPMVDKRTGEDEVLRLVEETNKSSAVVNKTIRTVGTIKVENVSLM